MRVPLTRAFILQFLTVVAAVNLSVDLPLAAQDGKVIIVQTNAAGDNISLIDAATNTVVGKIEGIEVNHGAAAAPDGSRFYISNEVEHTLDFVDARTLTITQKVSLSGRPNNVAIANDGRRVYIAIVSQPGAVDVIDTVSAKNVASIKTGAGVHNTFTTPDGKFVVAGSIAGRYLSVIDAASERVLWTLSFDAGVRPMSFETNPDGSTGRIFVQLSDFHGFAIVDFKERREIGNRIALPEVPERERHTEYLQGSPSHGQGITPDRKMLWLCSKINSHVYAYALPELKYVGGVRVGSHPDWLTFSPDSKYVYVANAGSNTTSVVDIARMTEVAQIPVGQVPKRIITARVPVATVAAWTAGAQSAPHASSREPLDYEFFVRQVQPIFLKKRDGNARCAACHANRVTFRLQPPPQKGATWTAEQSRLNFDAARSMVDRGNPLGSRLLLLPLTERAGGSPFHPGGKHWLDRNDPEWQILASWVKGTR
jgi:YVTN family beta-propeller protein